MSSEFQDQFLKAIQFDCMLRQKDVIGEWESIDEAGISDVIHGQHKWLRGLRWEEIDENLVLRHVTSKRDKPLALPLAEAPMVMEEIGISGRKEPARSSYSRIPAARGTPCGSARYGARSLTSAVSRRISATWTAAAAGSLRPPRPALRWSISAKRRRIRRLLRRKNTRAATKPRRQMCCGFGPSTDGKRND